ncbi:MAG: peroxiredoxin family protein [Proteobacteria bacterium]|nr:peroxiredoxin family protein [Pseudomonadota bacterium]
MRLDPGRPAVDFEVRDIFGQTRRLEDYRGRKLMLSLYRYASCPLCSFRVRVLIRVPGRPPGPGTGGPGLFPVAP